jgi:putative ABC transport system substrate-binding protein
MLFAGGVVTAWKPALAGSDRPRIGFIGAGTQQDNQGLLDTFLEGLSALGWNDGGNLTVLARWAEDDGERLPGITSELISSGVDIFVTAGTSATLITVKATKTLPIVLVGVGDPLLLDAVTGLAHPGGNVTGLSLGSKALVGKRLQLLHELVPDLRRVAVVVRDDASIEQTMRYLRANARQMNIELVAYEVTSGETVNRAFMHVQNDRCDAMYVASGPLGPAKRVQIVTLAAQCRLPVVYSFRAFAVAGGLMSYATDDRELFRRAATFVDKILKGAKPADLPVEEPTKFELVINLKTAKAIGLTIPPAILARADEVIE